ncbi:MAG: hypothetical protein H0V18_10710 [Pyrinomonadaceae bacterium]|jgi:hypothetical protein|nr:hypothetical protein [Pyrinomonadaceae bacterium]
MADQSKPRRRAFTILATVGILIELIAIFLLASGRVAVPVGMLLVIIGLFMAFFPVVIAGRKSQK